MGSGLGGPALDVSGLSELLQEGGCPAACWKGESGKACAWLASTDRPSCLQRPGSPGWARQLFSPPQHNCFGPTRGCWPFHILSAHLLGARSTPGAGMVLLRTSLMLCSPFRGGGRSHIGAPSLPKDRREMGAQGEIAVLRNLETGWAGR